MGGRGGADAPHGVRRDPPRTSPRYARRRARRRRRTLRPRRRRRGRARHAHRPPRRRRRRPPTEHRRESRHGRSPLLLPTPPTAVDGRRVSPLPLLLFPRLLPLARRDSDRRRLRGHRGRAGARLDPPRRRATERAARLLILRRHARRRRVEPLRRRVLDRARRARLGPATRGPPRRRRVPVAERTPRTLRGHRPQPHDPPERRERVHPLFPG